MYYLKRSIVFFHILHFLCTWQGTIQNHIQKKYIDLADFHVHAHFQWCALKGFPLNAALKGNCCLAMVHIFHTTFTRVIKSTRLACTIHPLPTCYFKQPECATCLNCMIVLHNCSWITAAFYLAVRSRQRLNSPAYWRTMQTETVRDIDWQQITHCSSFTSLGVYFN